MSKRTRTPIKGLLIFCLILSFVLPTSLKVEAASPIISLSNCKRPEALTVGEFFTVRGTVKSNYKLTKVVAYITTKSGKVVYAKSARPYSRTFNLYAFDSSLLFSKLKAGDYCYKIYARDTRDIATTLLKKSFVVEEEKEVQESEVTPTLGNEWLENCRKLHEYYGEHGFTYGAVDHIIPYQTESKTVCCAAYVSWCLYENGFLDEKDGTGSAQKLASTIYKKLGWEMNTDVDDIRAGDIIYYSQGVISEESRNAHIQWLESAKAGDGGSGMHVDISYNPETWQVLNAGSNAAIKKMGPSMNGESYTKSRFVCSFRFPEK